MDPDFEDDDYDYGDWVDEDEYWEPYVPDPYEEEVIALGDAQIAALQADVRARRQVCRHTHGAAFSETLGIVAIAMAARGR